MQCIARHCTGLALAILASGGAAQQVLPAQQPSVIQQTGPDEGQRPAESVPPPLPPMPSARPSHRWVDTDDHHTMSSHHHAARSRYHAPSAHHHASPTDQYATHEHHPTPHFSTRTIRECHGMTYQQVMRHSSCRALMREDLEAAEHRDHRTSHHKVASHQKVASHHKVESHRKAASHHHSTVRRHGG